MKAYSVDLRQRVAAARAGPGQTLDQVAARFQVSRSFVEKLRRRQRQTGLVTPAGGRRGPRPRLDEAARGQLAACVVARPDATLNELRQHLAAAGGPAVGRSCLWQGLRQLDLRRKKRVSTRPGVTPSA